MQRRQFVKLSGASLASLLFLQHTHAAGEAGEQIQLPQKIRIKGDDGFQDMTSADKMNWTYERMSVQLTYTGNALRVAVQSPGKALHLVQLQWQYRAPATATMLGDHWERTYGDVSFQPAVFSKKMPWYFIQHNNHSTVCFGVKTGCSAIAYWNVGNGIMQLTLDTRNGGEGVLLKDRKLHAADIVTTQNRSDENTFYAARRFCKIMCPQPRLPRQPVYGINDWYYAYGNNTPALIKNQTSIMTDLAEDTANRPFSVVDAGWAAYSPLLPGDCCWQDDFSRPNDKFKDMHGLAADITTLGMRPGLWTRPLCAAHDDKQNLLLPMIAGRDDAKKPVLDPTIAENLDRIQRNISTYKQWGFEMVKHDFSTFDMFGRWGFEMGEEMTAGGWHFNDRSKTNAEIILALYHTIRAAAGDMYLIGCNTMSHLSAGLFELNRVGDDTSGKEWARTRKMGVNTLGFRMVQHGIFYAADGDCVGLTNEVPWQKNKQWMQLLAESSTPLFISAQPDALGNEQKQFIKNCFTKAAEHLPAAEPLDWLTSQWPAAWKLDGKEVNFDW